MTFSGPREMILPAPKRGSPLTEFFSQFSFLVKRDTAAVAYTIYLPKYKPQLLRALETEGLFASLATRPPPRPRQIRIWGKGGGAAADGDGG